VNTASKTRGPLLLTAGGNDHTVPPAITTSTRKLYHKSPAITDLTEFPGRDTPFPQVLGVYHRSQFEVSVQSCPEMNGSANDGTSADHPFARARAARGGAL
jgi:hypothetical protein